MRRAFTFLLAPTLFSLSPACDAPADPQAEQRGPWNPGGKADGAATCVASCGEQAPGGCWCDETCAEYGDCCPDYAPICEGSGDAPPLGPTLLSDEYVTRYYWSSFAPLYRGHDAWVPYAVNIHPGGNTVLDVQARHYRWTPSQGLVDLGSETLGERPDSIGLSSAGELLSHGGSSNLLRAEGRTETAPIPNMWNSSTGGYRGEGTIFADANDGRIMVSVSNPIERTQVIDTRAFSGWQTAGTLRGHTAGVDRAQVLTLTAGEARVYSVQDPYAPELLAQQPIAQRSGGVLHQGVAYLVTAPQELSTFDSRTGERLAQVQLGAGVGAIVHQQSGMLFVVGGRTIEVVDISDRTEPVVVDAITVDESTGVRRIDGLSGAGDILHIWATDDTWSSTPQGENRQVRLRTLRLPQYL